VGSVLTSFRATDEDGGADGELTYQMISATDGKRRHNDTIRIA